MGNHKPAEVTKEQLEDAKAVWSGFTKYSKFSIIAICASLVLMALFLL